MPTFAEVMTELIQKHGGKKTNIARKLGLKPDGKPIYSSQLLGQYESGEIKDAKPAFYWAWKEKMGDDIESLMKGKRKNESSFRHEIFEGDYVGLHKLAWDEFKLTRKVEREALMKITQSNNNLSETIAEMVKNLFRSGGNQQG